MRTHRCRLTGRFWISIAGLHIGFGPRRFVERVKLGARLVYGR